MPESTPPEPAGHRCSSTRPAIRGTELADRLAVEDAPSLVAAKDLLSFFGIVLAGGTLGGVLAKRIHVPDVVVFLLVGIALGPEALGLVDIPAASGLNQSILIFGSCYVLFDGGASLRFRVLKKIWITIDPGAHLQADPDLRAGGSGRDVRKRVQRRHGCHCHLHGARRGARPGGVFLAGGTVRAGCSRTSATRFSGNSGRWSR